jgi:hypothetical protein
MNYKEIAWAAVIDFYIAGNNNKYVELFRNKNLINNLRQNPSSVPFKVFKDKIISDFLNSWGRMYIQDDTAKEIYDAIIALNPFTLQMGNDTLMTCNLSSGSTVCDVTGKIYDRLTGIWGINMVGFSKIAHILNDSQFPLIDNPIRKKYKKVYSINDSPAGYINWMIEMQKQACAVIADFQKQGFAGSPEIFLSQKLGYASVGCNKSLVKFLDEYYWLTVTHGVPIPPKWIP